MKIISKQKGFSLTRMNIDSDIKKRVCFEIEFVESEVSSLNQWKRGKQKDVRY